MDPIRQTVFTDPKKGKLGNCFNACLASLLELRLGEVPRFHLMARGHHERLERFLAERGYVYRGVRDGDPTGNGVDGHFIASYEVIDYPPYCHCVIWKDGRILHDPRDGGARLGDKVDHYFDITKKWPAYGAGRPGQHCGCRPKPNERNAVHHSGAFLRVKATKPAGQFKSACQTAMLCSPRTVQLLSPSLSFIKEDGTNFLRL